MMESGYGSHTTNGYSYDVGSKHSSLSRGGGGGGSGDVYWDKKTVNIRRVEGAGFGIAVSGGRDNAHFLSGETSIVVSEIMPNGPADGILKVNDRILSVDGIHMDNVDHADAVSALRRSGDVVEIAYKRKIVNPSPRPAVRHDAPSKQYVHLTKSRNESYGMRLGYKLFIEALNEYGVAAADGLKKGDTILSINDIQVEQLSLSDAQKIIERSRDGLDLQIVRAARSETNLTKTITGSLQSAPMQDGVINLQDAPPIPPPPADEEDEFIPPPRPPSPGQDDFRDGVPLDPEGECHTVSFYKGGSVGIKLIGGNEVGIYVAGIKPGSPAEQSGVAVADRIICVNDEIDLQGLTKEEVALLLLTLPDHIKLDVKHSRAAYRKVVETGRGDKFYIKAHFTYQPAVGEELRFPRGSVFRVVDTFPEGAMGYWYAIRLDRNNVASERGLVPNNSRASQSSLAQHSEETFRVINKDGGRGNFFKRRGIRASMRKGKKNPIEIKDQYDEIVFGGTPIKFPAYERVVLGEVGFVRPVVIFGPLADIARDKMIEQLPDKFETPLTEHTFDRTPGEQLRVNPQGIVKLGAIKDIMDKGKHCLLDVTPHAVEQLNLMQYYPIVIFLNADSRSVVKEIRGHYLTPELNKGSRKLYQTGKKLKDAFAHIFTAMIPLTTDGQWFAHIKDAVKIQQRREIWMSEQKFDEDQMDESILPVVGPLTLPADYDSDAESMLTESRADSTIDSDQEVDQMSPTATPTTSSAPESSFSFPAEQDEPKAELPKTEAPPRQYSSDEEEHPSSFANRRKPRSRKKKGENIWASLRRSISRSRSRSRDRRKEAQELEQEELEEERREEERREEERRERERREEEERYRRDTLEREQYERQREAAYEQEERPSRKDYSRRRDEAKAMAEEAISMHNRHKATTDLTNLVDELSHFELSADINGSSAPETEIIQARAEVQVESAPPPTRPSPPPPEELEEDTKPIQPVVSLVQQSAAPMETNLDDITPSYPTYESVEPKVQATVKAHVQAPVKTQVQVPVKTHVMETTFGAEEEVMDIPVAKPKTKDTGPKETTIDAAPPAWEIPDFNQERNLPPSRPPPPPPEEELPPPPKPDPVPPKPVEPLYTQVQKNKPSPRASPDWSAHGRVESPSSARRYQTSTPERTGSPQWGRPTPATSSPRWDRKAEPDRPDVQKVTVTTRTIPVEVKTVNLGDDKSEDELSADAYRKNLAKNAQRHFTPRNTESPTGWSKPSAEIRSVQAPRTTGNAYLDSKEARKNFFKGETASVQKPTTRPYDRESYQAYRERTKGRSKSPARKQYEEKSGFYPSQNNYNAKENGTPFKAVPVDEVALNADEGQEVVATVRGTFNSNGGVLNSPTTGVSIHIPEDAIPEGIQQELYFKVCRNNSMLPPLDKNKGETLLSPLVMCGPHGLKFQKPVELKLPHTASNTQDGWSFNLKSSDAAQGEPAKWKNVNIPGLEGSQAKPITNTVSVMVDHF